MSEVPEGRLDVATLRVIARRARTHPLVSDWVLLPDSRSPRRLRVRLDPDAYPGDVSSARLDVRWYTNGDYSFHYVENQGNDDWHRRWDRHPKPDQPREHVHLPPDAESVDESPLDADHHLDVLFAVLDWIAERVRDRYERYNNNNT